MNYTKLSEFLDTANSFLLGSFYGFYRFSNDKKLIYTNSSYKKSKFIADEILYKDSKENYAEILNSLSDFNLWHKNNNKNIKYAEFVFVLENDLNLNEKDFFNKLYSKILLSQDDWSEFERLNFIRGFFELRGSIDLKLKFLTLDYFYNSELEIKRIRILMDIFDLPFYVLNFNFRELQNQFISEENKRETQLRINLEWYISKIGLFNPYKIEITKTKYNDINIVNNITFFNLNLREFNKKNTFENRINFYSDFIYDKDLIKFDIKELRKELKFDSDESQNFKRDSNIVYIMKSSTKDECAACKKIYNIKDRSFLTRNDRFYTEIHHFVSVGRNKELDVFENLTKLCPVCHRALSRGSANESYQKELIKNILDTNEQNLEFAKIIFDSDDINFLTNKIYENLK